MRKILICMLAILMLLSSVLVACGGGDSGTESKPGESTSQPDTGKKTNADTSEPDISSNPGEDDSKPGASADLNPAKSDMSENYETDASNSAIKTPGEGLKYTLNTYGNTYSVTGIGSCTDTDIIIPATHPDDGKPVTSIGERAFYECEKLTSVTISYGIASIGDEAFCKCVGLTRVTIPDSVIILGNGTFSGCTSITSITIPYSVINIGDRLFSNCKGLRSVVIENGIKHIGSGAFYGCEVLTSVVIPNGVTTIGRRAFYGCNELISIHIPNSVKNIGMGTFSECKSLLYIVYGGDQVRWRTTISKESGWKNVTGDFTVYCTDGDISKDNA